MNHTACIIPIVEGPGDRDSIPDLLRRVCHEILRRYDILIGQPIVTGGKGRLIRKLRQYLYYAKIGGADATIVVVDADDDCPRGLGTTLAKSSNARLFGPVAIVCPKPEYEVWIIASLSKDQGHGIREELNIGDSVLAPDKVEELRNAKRWLKERMQRGPTYKPTQDQATLTHHISQTHMRDR